MGIIETTLIIVAATMAAIFVLNRPAFWSIVTFGRAKIGKASNALINTDPAAVIAQKIDEQAAKMKAADLALGTLRGLMMQSQESLTQMTQDEQRLINRINLIDQSPAGDQNGTLMGYVSDLDSLQKRIQVERKNLENLTTQVGNQKLIMKAAKEAIDAERKDAENKQLRLQISTATNTALSLIGDSVNGGFEDEEYKKAKAALNTQVYTSLGVAEMNGQSAERLLAEAKDAEDAKKADTHALLEKIRASRNGMQSVSLPAPAPEGAVVQQMITHG